MRWTLCVLVLVVACASALAHGSSTVTRASRAEELQWAKISARKRAVSEAEHAEHASAVERGRHALFATPELKEASENTRRAVERRTACPTGSNNQECSGHGTCNSQTGGCTCTYGWAGADCGVQLTQLQNGVAVRGQSVSTFGWRYFHIDVQYLGTGLRVEVNQTTVGDSDIYIQTGRIPTRQDFLVRDLGVAANSKINIQSVPSAGTYYIGVYGFIGCSFDIAAYRITTCPNQCSGHGTCSNGDCLCAAGYSGNDCSLSVTDLTLATPVTGSVPNNGWKTYRLLVPAAPANSNGRQLIWTMTQTSPSGDCDIYIRKGSEPTLFQWDYSNVTIRDFSQVYVENPAADYWYAGVHGFSACTYTMEANIVTLSNACTNKCSGRGQCNGATDSCACQSLYSGSYCERLTSSMLSGTGYPGYVEDNQWNYFTYDTNTADNLVISVEQNTNPPNADCDLYVKQGADPTRLDYDFQDVGVNKSFSLSIASPGQATWHFGIYGWTLCNYTITASEGSSCPNSCSNHGSCDSEGHCLCNAPYVGEDCSQSSIALTSNTVASSTVAYNEWKYFTFTVPAGATSMHIQLKEKTRSGNVWVLVDKQTPDLRTYEWADTSTGNTIHRVVASYSNGNALEGTYTIGVYGNPYMPQDSTGDDFDIIAWAPQF